MCISKDPQYFQKIVVQIVALSDKKPMLSQAKPRDAAVNLNKQINHDQLIFYLAV